jgi:hypothetical protein
MWRVAFGVWGSERGIVIEQEVGLGVLFMVVVVGASAIVDQQSELVVVDEKTCWVGTRTWQLVEGIHGYFEGFQDNVYFLVCSGMHLIH